MPEARSSSSIPTESLDHHFYAGGSAEGRVGFGGVAHDTGQGILLKRGRRHG